MNSALDSSSSVFKLSLIDLVYRVAKMLTVNIHEAKTQLSKLIDLYDPQRSRGATARGVPTSWTLLAEQLRTLKLENRSCASKHSTHLKSRFESGS